MSQTTNTAISCSSDTVALSTSSSQYPMHHSHLFTSSSSFVQTTMQPTNHKNTTNNAISQTIHPHCDLLKTKSIPTRSNVKKSTSCSIGTNHSNDKLSLTRDLQQTSATPLCSSQDRSSSRRPINNHTDLVCNQGLKNHRSSYNTHSLQGLHIGYTLPEEETNENHSCGSKHSHLMNAHCMPRPNIMPRSSNTVSNVSINGRTGIMSSPKGGNGVESLSRSNMSAFTCPNNNNIFMDGSSPVPSIIASDCSDGTHLSRTPNHNYNHEFDQNSFGYEQWGMYGSSRPSVQTSPRNQDYYMTGKATFDHSSYFTPIKSEQHNTIIASYQQQQDQRYHGYKTPQMLPEGYYPQCQEVPRSISMNGINGNSINGFDGSTGYPRHDSSNSISNNVDLPMYCLSIGSAVESNLLQMQRPSITQEVQIEVPPRSRKNTTESNESNLISFKSMSSDESTGSMPLHLPQNLKGDPHRQAKVKTELCLHYARGKICPYGSRCNYAHGEHELKYTKLYELQKAGLVEDISTYRCHPCASWVATGACPFGLRCSNLHDPRIASKIPSWLPHSDIPVSTLQTELTVDKSYHQNQAMLNQENPLVHNLLWAHRPSHKKFRRQGDKVDTFDNGQSEWKDTYSLVCNMANLYPWKKFSNKGVSAKSKKVSELEKLCIAMKMSYSSDSNLDHLNFVYKAQYTVYDELCMVLQTKYFLMLRPSQVVDHDEILPIDSVVREISIQEYKGRTTTWNKKYPYCPNDVVAVKELTFGCLGEPSSKVSLWFDLPDPVLLTNQEIKRFKRNRQQKLQENNRFTVAGKTSPFPGVTYATEKSFESHPHKPFFHMRPISNDPTTLELLRDILNHRISVLIRRKFHVNQIGKSEGSSYQGVETELENRFQRIKKDMLRWQWPVSKGREDANANTLVPSCSEQYNPSKDEDVTQIWDSFLETLHPTNSRQAKKSNDKRRLPVFSTLSKGMSTKYSKNDSLPHIKSDCIDENISCNEAWKFICGDIKNSEWSLIKDNYYVSDSEVSKKDVNMPLSPPQGEKLTKN